MLTQMTKAVRVCTIRNYKIRSSTQVLKLEFLVIFTAKLKLNFTFLELLVSAHIWRSSINVLKKSK